jgi:tricorn protease
VALTTGNDCYIWGGVLSPNGKVLVWQDARKRLRSLRLDDPARTIRQLDASDYGEFSGLAFSPDSRWLAYVRPGWQTANRIWLYSFQAGTRTPATDAWHDAASPAFSPDGNYLYFVSARDFSPVYSRTEWNTAYANMDRLCLLLLRRTALNPLRPDYGDLRPDTTRLNTARQVQVDFEGLSDRVVVLPPPGAQYTGLLAVGKRLFYLMSKQGDTQSQLRYFDLAEQKEGTAAAQADGLALTPNATHVAYLHRKDKKIVLLTPNSGKTEPAEHKRLDYATVGKVVNLRAEWNQIYHEAWRQMRDFFYAPNLHGVNWPAMRDKYRVLLPHARHRSDVSYLIGELIGELNAGHAYVNNGQAPRPDRLKLGQLGIDTERDATTGAVQITRILHGFQDLRSPLAEPGLGVKTGHWIIAVNGRRLTPEVPDLNAALVNTAGQPTELTLATTAQGANPRTLTVVPLEDEADLRYVEWVQRNLRYVHEQTNGRVGYLHIPDMSAAGLNEFVKYFYPQLDKEALIIDDRGNGGGNVSPMIIERLRRELDMVLMSRGNRPTPSPTDQLVGPKVLLIDQYSASDGDLFAYRFKHYKLGKVVGVRSWGGTVGIRSSLPFVDGSTLHKPEFSRYDVAGKDWIIEGYGVDPDITVVNDPAREYLGYDDQLDEAIRQATRALENRKGLAPMPPYPDKTR